MTVVLPSGSQVSGTSSLDFDEGRKWDYSDRYPHGIDLRPSSETHRKLLTKIMGLARQGHDILSSRRDSWDKVQESLTVFITKDEAEEQIKADDERRPVSLVIPLSFATLETMMTYWVSAFLQDPIFRYDGVGPEDVMGAAILEILIQQQAVRSKMALPLYVMGRDSFSFGFGAVTPQWDVRYGYRTRKRERGFMSAVTGFFERVGFAKEAEEAVLYEGNRLYEISPYDCILDPKVPIHRVQDGSFFGFVARDSYTNLIELEDTDETYFNTRYLSKNVQSTSVLYEDREQSSRREDAPSKEYLAESPEVDRICLYVKLIPKHWDLGEGESPEKWFFVVAGDNLIIAAGPADNDHNMFPVGISAPDFDGHSMSPISRLEMIHELQTSVDWMWNSHVHNVRKALNDMFVVDPRVINIHDVANPAPGKLIRARLRSWSHSLKDSIMQLGVADVTKGSVQDITVLEQLIQRVTGAVDAIQGIPRQHGERVSATEAAGVRTGALSKLEMLARLSGFQAFQDIGYMLASQTQQEMSRATYAKIIGRWEEVLYNEYGKQPGSRVKVEPEDILVEYDVIPQDGTVPDPLGAQGLIQMFQIVATNEVLMSQFDVPRLFMHIARIMGAKDVQEFVKSRQLPQIQSDVVPTEQAMNEAAAGNIVPLEEVAKSYG